MNNRPDEALFSKNERADEYEVRFSVRGTFTQTIKASSPEEARSKAEELMDDDEFGLELDDLDALDIRSVRKTPAMFRIIRDGKNMQSSWLVAGDLPREPDERGF